MFRFSKLINLRLHFYVGIAVRIHRKGIFSLVTTEIGLLK